MVDLHRCVHHSPPPFHKANPTISVRPALRHPSDEIGREGPCTPAGGRTGGLWASRICGEKGMLACVPACGLVV